MKKKVIFILIAAVLCAVGLFRYHQLNQKYPPAELETYQMGQTLVLEQMEITLKEKNILKQNDFFEKYQITGTQIQDYYEQNPTLFLVACFQIKNIAAEVQNYQKAFSEDAIEYKTFANGEDVSFFFAVNPELTEWNGDLEPQEEKEVFMVFPVSKSLMTEKHWEEAESYPYQIVLRNYRKKIVIQE